MHFGIEKINKNPGIGIHALKIISAYTDPYSVLDVVFKLGPRINAAGRLKHASLAVDLLTTSDIGEAMEIAKLLDQNNTDRKDLDSTITKEPSTDK